MAAHIGQPTRSRRFIKVYLMTWALLAVGAVAYLTLLAYPQPWAAPSRPDTAEVDAAKAAPAAATAAKALAEVRGSLTEIRKDVTHLQDAMGDRVASEKVVKSRLTALEERVATIEPGQTPPATPPTSNSGPKPSDKSEKSAHADTELTTADMLARTKDRTAAVPPSKSGTPPPPETIETGSIGGQDEIVFGEAVVTHAGKRDFAVQLAAGPSLQVLRHSWGQLVERHGTSLASLKPRIIAPRSEGGIYRLLAGPVPTKADADRICAELGGGPKACFVTAYGGAPL
jgi:SPOR domain